MSPGIFIIRVASRGFRVGASSRDLRPTVKRGQVAQRSVWHRSSSRYDI